ncbi:S9 family peptidase [Candidatus Neomarinimicrobiota bacterium]
MKTHSHKLNFIILILLFIFTNGFSQVERIEKGNLVIEGIPEIPDRIVNKMMQYQNTRSAFIEDWFPSGDKMLISTRFAETSQLHVIEKEGGARKQITFFKEPIGGASVCPNPETNGFLFTKDIGGNEYYQVFYYNFDSGDYNMLTDGSSRNGGFSWSNKGDKFVYYSTKRNGRDWDLYINDMSNPTESKLILEEGGFWIAVDWSPCDKYLLVIKYISANESYYYILNTKDGELEQINPIEEIIAYGEALWSKDGKGIYIVNNEGNQFLQLKYYDIKKKKFKTISSNIPWDIEQLELSKDGKQLAFVSNEDGLSKLYILNTKTNEYNSVPNIPIGQVYGLDFHPSGDELALVINTPKTPGDIYVVDLKNNEFKRWTYSEVGGLQTDTFIEPQLIHFNTFDGVKEDTRKIPAFYFKPTGFDKPYPVIIYIHGGPEGQYIPYFSSIFQYLINELGVAVLAPNVRGSSGYGKDYLLLDNGYKREDSVKDIGKLIDWVYEQPELDNDRIAVWGGSYGGYMVLASMTHFNEKLACGIDNVGISNFVTFLENTKEYRRDLRRPEYGDERIPEMREFLEKISPNNNVEKISKPMFIIQGLNDPRVPVGESEQIVSAIRENGGDVWYLLANDEGHGFRKKSNRDYYTNSMMLFLERNLLER